MVAPFSISGGRRAWLSSLLACVALACGRGGSEEAAAAPLTIRIGLDMWPGYYPLLFAEVDPQLRADGVSLELFMPEDTDAMLLAFTTGACDGVAVALGDLITLAQGEADAGVILVSDESAGGDAVVGRGAFAGSESLRGARVGTNLGGFGELFVRELLGRHGVSPAQLSLMHVEAAEVPARLADGTIDAGHTWEPYVSEALGGGAQLWFSSAQTPGLIPDVLALRGEFIAKHPREIEALCAAWFRGVERWRSDPAGGAALIGARLGVSAQSISLEGIKILDRAANLSLMDPAAPSSLHAVAERYIDFFIERGMLRSRPSPSRLLRGSYL